MRWWRRADAQHGAVAVVVAVVLIGFIVPVVAFGVTTFLRGNYAQELQQAADEGALAGAAQIPLASPQALLSLVDQASNVSGIDSPLPGQPQLPIDGVPTLVGQATSTAELVTGSGGPQITSPTTGCDEALATSDPAQCGVACTAAMSALRVADLAFGVHGAQGVTCQAQYLGDASFFADFAGCLSSTAADAANAANLAGLTPTTVSEDLTPVLSTLSAAPTTLLQGPLQGYASVLPALLHPGVVVTLTGSEQGPLDHFDPGFTGATVIARTGVARRTFKNVLVVPEVGPPVPLTGTLVATLLSLGLSAVADNPTVTQTANSLVGPMINLNPALGVSVSQLNTLESQLEAGAGTLGASGACQALVPALNDELTGLVNPPSGGPTAASIIQAAEESATPVLTLELPDVGELTSSLQIPFLDFVPVCVPAGTSLTNPTGVVASASTTVGCSAATPGAFAAHLVNVT